ncbi:MULTISPECIES: hypothetical protein [Microbacterium]|uniref:hypothetical protein n=1 Tax=Microbacterium TaxID=33882 RepID=UPI0022F089C1|nr:hypothetical protein [Streptomyces sp. MS2A]
MWLRRVFFRWLPLAAAVLPVWLLVGWGVFQAGGWAFLWVLFIAVPSVLVGQLVLLLLVRARPSVRAERAVSWWDVLGFTVWHGLTVAVGCFPEGAFAWLLTGAIAAFLALFWSSLWQLWSEARGGRRVDARSETVWATTIGGDDRTGSVRGTPRGEVIVIAEAGRPGDAGGH